MIHVNISSDLSSCVKTDEALVCPTLNLALQSITQSSTIYLDDDYDDVYILEPGNETRIWNRSAIAIIGNSALINPNPVTINCQNETGLSFIQTNNIKLESVQFVNCSGTQVSTTRNFYSTRMEYLQFTVAIFMKHCINVTLRDVTVTNTDGVGVTMYNTVGVVSIINCTFTKNDNKHKTTSTPGGGGLQIELSKVAAGGSNDQNDMYLTGASYTISSSKFKDNAAHYRQSVIIVSSSFSPGLTNDEFNLGKGGGFSIIIRGQAANNSFIVRNCSIQRNNAHWGGGFYVSFQESSSNNTVQLIDSKVDSNHNFDVENFESQNRHFDIDGGGGGGKVLYTSSSNTRNNSMTINNCLFTGNDGVTGGGLWVESVIELNSNGNHFKLMNSKFHDQNKAFLGSALYFSGQFLKGTANAVIENTSFINNYSLCGRIVSQGYAYLPCAGILYAVNFPLILKGKIVFKSNKVTALEVHEGSIDIVNGSELIFTGNTAQYGGALALYDCSFMTIYPNTSLVFTQNHADIYGGAIYSGSCSGAAQPAAVSFRCFVRYSNSFIHPDLWETKLFFESNTEGTGMKKNQIDMYVTSLQSCWWPKNGSLVITHDDYKDTFCWAPWKFTKDCNTSFYSSPSFIHFPTNDKQLVVNIYPGQDLPMPVVFDGTFQETQLTTNFVVCIVSGLGSFSSDEIENTCTTASTHNSVQLFWPKNIEFHKYETTLISMQINQKVGYGATVYVQFQECQWPLHFNQSQCMYSSQYFDCHTTICGIDSPGTPKPQYCLTNDPITGEPVIGLCPPLYSDKPLIKWDNDQDTAIIVADSCSYNQSGRLCGGCVNGYAVPVNSLHHLCYECSGNDVLFGWLVFMLLQILPMTIFVVLIFLFGIDLNKGTIVGFVFYWQMISLNCPAWYYPAWFSFPTAAYSDDGVVHSAMMARAVTFLYSITNLNFLVIYEPVVVFPICISRSMDSVSTIAFWYVIPVSALCLTAAIAIWRVLYDKGYSCILRVFVPVRNCLIVRLRRKFKISEASMFKSIASVYILCFTQIGTTSFQLLHFATWHSLKTKGRTGKIFFYDGNLDYFGAKHAPYAIVALLMLFGLVLVPMLFITLYPSKTFHRFLLNNIKHKNIYESLKEFGDTFTGCYRSSSENQKLDYRYFAGLMLWLRIVILFFYYIPGQYSDIILYLESAVTVILAGAIMIFRPFRTDKTAPPFTNFLNFFLMTLLGMMTILSLIFGQEATLINLAGIIHIPTLLIIVYVIIRFFKYFKACRKSRGRYVQVPTSSDDDDDLDDFADRFESSQDNREFEWLSSQSEHKPKTVEHTVHTSSTQSTIQGLRRTATDDNGQ